MKLISRLTVIMHLSVAPLPAYGDESIHWSPESADSASIVMHGEVTLSSALFGKMMAVGVPILTAPNLP